MSSQRGGMAFTPSRRPAMPRGLRAMQEQVLDTHELSLQAAMTCDVDVLRRAMLTDPLVSSIADADAIIGELLKLERDALPKGWQKQSVRGGRRLGSAPRKECNRQSVESLG